MSGLDGTVDRGTRRRPWDPRREMEIQAALALSLMFTGGDCEEVRAALLNGLALADELKYPSLQMRLLGALHIFLTRSEISTAHSPSLGEVKPSPNDPGSGRYARGELDARHFLPFHREPMRRPRVLRGSIASAGVSGCRPDPLSPHPYSGHAGSHAVGSRLCR